MRAAEEARLIGSAKNGDPDALERVVVSHLAMAWAEIRRTQVPLDLVDDALQEVAEALVRAVARFDPARGTRFNTYARWFVRDAVRRIVTPAELPLRHEPAATDAVPTIPFSFDDLDVLATEPRGILLLRYGFVDGREYSQREVARLLGCSRHHVRTVEGEAVAHLHRRLANVGPRAPSGADPL